MTKVIIKPLISEKQTSLVQKNQYVFYVNRKANKKEIKKAVEDLYKVKVKTVQTLRSRKVRRIKGTRLEKLITLKKAIVKLAKGQNIPDLMVKEEKKEEKENG